MAVMVYRFVRRKSGKGKNWEDVQNPQKTEPNIRWKWRGLRWLLAYLGFWLVAGGGAGVIARSTSPEIQGGASSFVTLIVIHFSDMVCSKRQGQQNNSSKSRMGSRDLDSTCHSKFNCHIRSCWSWNWRSWESSKNGEHDCWLYNPLFCYAAIYRFC